jgi:16S rRNA (cytidine1402-2'-O)-methyltransferase
MDTNKKSPKLYLIPVPLSEGAADRVLPQYNIALLREISYFVVENLRSARRFLKLCDKSINIDELHFVELNEHTPIAEVAEMLAPMQQGHSIGVISEAGCPAVADPGADLVAVAQTREYEVVPLVGPSSILMSLMGSGFNGQSFAFNGYLPIEASKRTARLKEFERRIRTEQQTQIFIETPYRNNKLIAELAKAMPGDIKLCVASDITGERQKITTLPLREWKNRTYDYNKIPTIFLLNR